MNFEFVTTLVNRIITSLESAAIESVKNLKAHTFSTRITNLPKTQAIKGTVTVANQRKVESELKKLLTQAKSIETEIKSKEFPKSFEVTNFPEAKAPPEFPKSFEVSNFPSIDIPKTVAISNQPTKELSQIYKTLEKLNKGVSGLKLDPKINIEAPKPERLVVPPAQVNVTEKEIDYTRLAKLLTSSIKASTEKIDYLKLAETMAKELGQMVITGGGGGGGSFADPTGRTTKALVDSDRHLQVDVVSSVASAGNALDAYNTNNVDESSATITYVGTETADGDWCIKKIDTTSGTVISYATITNNESVTTYTDAWTDRGALTYNNYSGAF